MAKEKKKKSKLFKIILTVILALVGVFAILALIFAGSIFKLRKNAIEATKDINADTFREAASSIIYDINGEEITTLSGNKELYYIENALIPDILKKTFVLIEDKDFYSHHGVDMSAIIRASIANMRHNAITQGASTITQQLARNIFLTQDVSWERKITEMFAAIELEKKFSKNQIMEFYVNNIYFANGYYGIEAAAQGYFGKTTGDLSLSQLVFLAGIPNNPTKYNPAENMDKAIERRDYILKQLFAEGYVSNLDYYGAIEEPIEIKDKERDSFNYVETYVFYCATRALMEQNGFEFRYEFASEDDEAEYNEEYDRQYSDYQASLFSGGYKIYTSIDMEKQKLLQDILDENLKNFRGTNNEGIFATQGAAVCIDNSTGLVTAIVGGRNQDYDGYTLNRAYQSYRQPGSAIKPLLVYAPYLALGHTPDEIVDDSPIVGGPTNVGDKYRGDITLTEALGWSSNVCAWKLMENMTPPYAMGYLHNMNFRKIAVDDERQAVSIGGFTYGVSPVELASAYATLENDGQYRNPSCIDRITTGSGKTLVEGSIEETEVYSENVARTVTKMMEYGVNKGLLTDAKLKNAIVAAKSGTTNDSKDGWLAGYSRYYTTVVWVGNDIPVAIQGLSGGSYPLYIWRDFMEEIHKGLELKPFPDFDGEADMHMWPEDPEAEEQTEEETHPHMGDNTINTSDGDHFTDISGTGDQDVDLSGLSE